MKCPRCGAEVVPQALFCQKCGTRVAEDGSTAKAGPGGNTGQPATAVDPGLAAARGLGRRAVADVPEEVLWEGGYSAKALAGSVIACGVLTAVLLIAAVLLGQTPWWWLPLALAAAVWLALLWQFATRRLSVHYKLTNKFFFHERGVVKRVTNRIEVIDIDDISFEQGPVDRMLGVGRIKITSSDRTDPELRIEGIENVQQVAGLLDNARRAERLRRGVSVEQV